MNHKADNKYPAIIISLLLIAVLNTFGQQNNIQDGKGILRIFSEPAGAKINIDNKSMGITPLKIVNVDTGERLLSLQLQGYAVYENPLHIKANESQNVSVVLKKEETPVVDKPQPEIFDTLAVNTIPSGATVFINGKQSGTTPYRNEKMAPGTYKLRLELSGYDTLNGFAILKAGEFHAIEKKLASIYGILSVSTTPPGAAVFLNDQNAGTTPYRNTKLEHGSYSLRLEMTGYTGVPPEKITVEKEAVINRQYTLMHSQTWSDSATSFTKAKHNHRRWVRRILFGSLSALAGGAGYYFDTQVAAEVSNQNNIATEYSKATSGFNGYVQSYNDAGKKAHDNAETRNILYGAAGTFAALFVISIPF